MAQEFAQTGSLGRWDVPSILQCMNRFGIDGQLQIRSVGWEKSVFIEEQRVRFASSTLEEDTLGSFLLRRKVIDADVYKRSTEYMRQNKVKHGRALLEMGIIRHDHLWEHVLGQLRHIVFSLFSLRAGEYAIHPIEAPLNQNIALNNDIPTLLIDGIRQIADHGFIDSRFAADGELFPRKIEKQLQIKLKPFELHVLHLVRNHNRIDDVLACSELLPFDTLKTLYLLRVLDAISDQPGNESPETAAPVARHSFATFQEALAYFNGKYTYIYRLLSKQIGPVAQSILSDSVADIMETLPPFFAHLQLSADGSLDDEPLLKALWYRNANETMPEFLRGLEEILYAEVYAVRKHLGRESEQAILQWIREAGD
jgi:hypothetical protein